MAQGLVAGRAGQGRLPWGWPFAPLVVAHALPAEGAVPRASSPGLPRRVLAPDLVLVEPAGARVLLVGAIGGGFTGELHELSLAPGELEREVVLVAPAAPELARVDLVVALAPTAEGRRPGPATVVLEDPRSSGALLAFALKGEGSRSFALPTCALRLVVHGESYVDYHGRVAGPRSHGRAALELDLRPGERHSIALVLEEGARLDVLPEGLPTAEDRAAVAARRPGLEPAELDREAALVRLRLEAPGRPTEDVPRVVVLRPPPPVHHPDGSVTVMGGSAYGPRLETSWPLGVAEVSVALPSGRATLVGTTPGGREARAEVELVAGATTQALLFFE